LSVAGRSAVAMLGALLAMPAFPEEPAAAAFLGRLAGAWEGTGEVRQMAADMRSGARRTSSAAAARTA
jgi:hypothetical protein